jgi:hypothetical protein
MTQPEKQTDFVEYAGDPVHGTAFLSSHTITKKDPLWARNGVEMEKDLTWERDPSVPIGQKGAKMLLLTKDIPAAALKVLVEQPGFKQVSR